MIYSLANGIEGSSDVLVPCDSSLLLEASDEGCGEQLVRILDTELEFARGIELEDALRNGENAAGEGFEVVPRLREGDGGGGDDITGRGTVNDIDKFTVVGGGEGEAGGAGIDAGVEDCDGDAGTVDGVGASEMGDAGGILGDEVRSAGGHGQVGAGGVEGHDG